MPRDLADVLHYFLPDLESDSENDPQRRPTPRAPEGGNGAGCARDATGGFQQAARLPAALPTVAVPIGDRDVVRAAFTWNLAVEVSRLGGRAAIVSPQADESVALWPGRGASGEPEPGPLALEVHPTPARNIRELRRAALDVAVQLAPGAEDGGLIFVRIPPRWLSETVEAGRLLRWILLFTSTDRRDLLEAYGLAKLALGRQPAGRIGVTIHGARHVSEAQGAFARLARAARTHLDTSVSSYGLLVDDLHVYRAIVAQRPIGLEHPQSPAARALRDVARLLLGDAREMSDA